MTRLLAVVPALALVLAVGGCATATDSPRAHRMPSASPTPTASATPDASGPDLAPPATLVPGSCSDFVAQSAADRAAGGSTAPDTSVAATPVMRQAGDLRCEWSDTASGTGSTRTFFLEIQRDADTLEADPAGFWTISGPPAGVEADRSALHCASSEDAAGQCRIDARVGDYRITAIVYTPQGAPTIDRRPDLQAAVRPVIGRLRSEPTPERPRPARGSWPAVIDCGALASAAGSSAAWRDVTGVDYLNEVDISDAVGRRGGRSACLADAGAVEMVSGAGWSLTRVDPGSERVDVAGADLAELTCQEALCSLDARVGVNRFTIFEPGALPDDVGLPTRDELTASAGRLVAALRSLYP